VPGTIVRLGDGGRVLSLSGALCGKEPRAWHGRRLPDVLGGEPGRTLSRALDRLEAGAPHVEVEVDVRLGGARAARSYRFRLARAARAAGPIAGVVTDVTAERAEERAQREQEAHSHRVQKSAMLAYLAGGVAHDFNNLLTVIVGGADLLREDPRLESDSEQAAELSQIQRAAERASEITRQLLAYSRREPTLARDLDLSAHVTRLEPLLARLLGPQIHVTRSSEPDLWPVHVDPVHVEHVLTQLALNARHGMPHGGIIWISLRNVRVESFERHGASMVGPGEYVELRVRDSGVGMTDAALARVFEPFFIAPPGAGSNELGLPFVRSLVVQAFGHIWVESEPGRGSMFVVLWPRHAPGTSVAPPPPDADAPATSRSPRVKTQTAKSRGERAKAPRATATRATAAARPVPAAPRATVGSRAATPRKTASPRARVRAKPTASAKKTPAVASRGQRRSRA
jgi:signal transduction histidine kinase